MDIKVVKRDGKIEKYNPEKIIRVVMAAGLTKAQAQELAKKVTSWVKLLKDKSIPSLRIRDKVIQEIQKSDKYSANAFIWYQKIKDKGDNSG